MCQDEVIDPSPLRAAPNSPPFLMQLKHRVLHNTTEYYPPPPAHWINGQGVKNVKVADMRYKCDDKKVCVCVCVLELEEEKEANTSDPRRLFFLKTGEPRKKPSYFSLNPGLLIRILIIGLWNNPYITWVGSHPLYNPKQPEFFSWLRCDDSWTSTGWWWLSFNPSEKICERQNGFIFPNFRGEN